MTPAAAAVFCSPGPTVTCPVTGTGNVDSSNSPGWNYEDTYFVTIKAAGLPAGFSNPVSTDTNNDKTVNSLDCVPGRWCLVPNPDGLHNSPAKPCPCDIPTADPKPTIVVDSTTVSGQTTITYAQSLAVNDNSYGSGTDPSWGTKTHTFSNLFGSDKLQVVITKGLVKKYDFVLDYIGVDATAPSGYSSLGPTGGDGSTSMDQGVGSISDWSTSLDDDLNVLCLPATGPWTTNSPVSPGGAGCTSWNFVNSYTVTVAGSFTVADVTFPLVHNSPAKPSGCPTTTPPGPGACSVSVTKREVKDRQVKITLKNGGSADAFLTALNGVNWPPANGLLKKIKLGRDVIYDKPDLAQAGAPYSLGVPPLTKDKNHRKIGKGKSEVLTFEFEKNADTNLANYAAIAQFLNCNTDLVLLPKP
jgi:hypothetical protein